MTKTILIIIVILVVVVGGYFLLRGWYQAPTQIPTLTAPTEEVTPGPEKAITSPTIKEITVSGSEYLFNPSSITVSAGERVRVIFRNEGRIAHNFVIRDLGVSTKTIGAGQTDIVEFTAPVSGTYNFICSVPGHAVAGMEGDLLVK